MTRLAFTSPAESDVVEIVAYLDERSDTAADIVLAEIEATCLLIQQHPSIGRRRPDLGDAVLSLPSGTYVVFYEHDDAARTVTILRVLHQRRDVTAAF
mgnify:CR=1 FL=1